MMYDTFELLGPGEVKLASNMARLWQNFAWTGSPSSGPHTGVPDWPAFGTTDYSTTGGTYVSLMTQGISTHTAMRKPFCDFWQNYTNPFLPWVNPKQP